MTNSPRTLDELRAIDEDEEQIAAARAYLDRVRDFEQQALALRDEAINRLIVKHGPSEAARRAGVSLTTVKAVRRRT